MSQWSMVIDADSLDDYPAKADAMLAGIGAGYESDPGAHDQIRVLVALSKAAVAEKLTGTENGVHVVLSGNANPEHQQQRGILPNGTAITVGDVDQISMTIQAVAR